MGNEGIFVKQLRTLFTVGAIRDLTDGQLLELFSTERGEAAETAFAALVERHGPMVLRVCRSVLNDSHDSQDAFQATFLVLVKKARGLWVRDSLGPWLHQVALRTASCARTSAARRGRIERSAAQLRKESFTTTVSDDLGGALHEEIERLPERFRAPVVLCDLQGRSHEQAARRLGWPIGTVKSRQARARDRLRNRLIRRGLAPSAGFAGLAVVAEDASAMISPALVDSTARAALEYGTIHTFLRGSTAILAQGVLRSMSANRYLRAASFLLVVGATVSGAGWLAQRGGTPAIAQAQQVVQVPRGAELISYAVKRGPLLVNVIERGSLEASSTLDAYCMVESQTTIIAIKSEGAVVKKGDIVCELGSASLRDQLINQQITEKASETEYHRAEFSRETAEIALRALVDGTLPRERERLKSEIELAQSAIERARASQKRARDAGERLKTLAAASTPADVAAELDIVDRHDAADQTIEREKKALELAKAQLDALEKYTAPRQTRELTADIGHKKSDELAKKAAWELAMTRTRKLERMIAACMMKAEGNGILIYANDPIRRTFANRPAIAIEEGATVRERQLIFRIYDLTRPLRVNAKIPEVSVTLLAPGMHARVRVDAFPDTRFNGKVTDVAPLPDPATFFSDNRKVYTTHVLLQDGIPALRPGMNAQAEIIVKDLDNVVSVPVSAVLHFDDRDQVAVKKPDGRIAWTAVTAGISNTSFVEIKEGIESGDQVVANPLALLTDDEKRAKLGKPTRNAMPVPKKGTGNGR